MKNIPLYEAPKISNLREMLHGSVEKYKEHPAFLYKAAPDGNYLPISFIQFEKDVNALGAALLKLNLKGKRIAVMSENRYEWCTTYLSAVNGLGIIVPIDKELPGNEIVNCINRAEVSAIVFSGKKADIIEEIRSETPTVEYFINMDLESDDKFSLSYSKLLENGRESISQGSTEYIQLDIHPEAINILLFTSATTSEAKAVQLSQRNICENLMAMSAMTWVGYPDIFLSVLPMHHTYECTCGFLCATYKGCTVAFCEGLRHIQKNMNEASTSVMLGVPLVFETMYKRIWSQAEKHGQAKILRTGIKISNFLRTFGIDITRKLFKPIYDQFGENIRLFISGAAGIDPIVAKGFRDFGIGFIQGYGLTECAPIVALNRNCDFKDDAAGLPLPGLDVRIHEPGQEGIGEIIVKGPSVMIGYYQEPEATSQSFTGDGFFRTGDLGYIDNDGFVHITGRKKNVIVTKNGKNIYPEEIETLLNRSPFIKESMVYGKEEEDEVTVAASIVPDMDYIQEHFTVGTVSDEQISDLINDEIKNVNHMLTTYKYIKNIIIREEEFVKTTTKKIKRYMEKTE